MSFTQIILFIFLIFALSRVFFRFKDGILPLFGFLFWSIIFGIAIVLVLFPDLSSRFAKIVGIGRGADIVLYVSIVLLFYLIFRLYIYMEDVRRDLSTLVQKLALKELKKKNVKKTS